jgi:hypothetical protein
MVLIVVHLYHETTEKFKVTSNSFLQESRVFYMQEHVNRENFTLSFLFWMLFITFSYLINLARTSSIMLNSSDESGNSFLAFNLK